MWQCKVNVSFNRSNGFYIFKQARQAYLIGNKALAKELSVKGQLHNIHMKAAHGKAQETVYRLRFVNSGFLIDLGTEIFK